MKRSVENPYAQASAADIQYRTSTRSQAGANRGGFDDDGRNSLFAGANKDRFAQDEKTRKERRGNGYGGAERENLFAGSNLTSGAYTEGGADGGYGERRERSKEELEEQDVMDNKSRIAEVKDQSVNSSRRALKAGEAAMESSRAIMSRLGVQGERLYNAKSSLEQAQSHNKVSQDRTRELKHLNRSMFAMGTPFHGRGRQEEYDAELLDRNRDERDQRDSTRRDAYESSQRIDQAFKDMDISRDSNGKMLSRNLVSRSKYQFEADEADDAKEDEIEDNVSRLHNVAKQLRRAGQAIGNELDQQNKLISSIDKMSDKVDDEVRANRASLAKIK